MANLGVLTTKRVSVGVRTSALPPKGAATAKPVSPAKRGRVCPTWFGEEVPHTVDDHGSIVATVKVKGVPTDLLVGKCIHRATGKIVASAISDANGTVTFSNLNRNAEDAYYVIFFSSAAYNAIVYDKLTAT